MLETGAAVVGRGVAGVLPHPSVTNTQQHEYRHSTFLCMFVEFVSYPWIPVTFQRRFLSPYEMTGISFNADSYDM